MRTKKKLKRIAIPLLQLEEPNLNLDSFSEMRKPEPLLVADYNREDVAIFTRMMRAHELLTGPSVLPVLVDSVPPLVKVENYSMGCLIYHVPCARRMVKHDTCTKTVDSAKSGSV